MANNLTKEEGAEFGTPKLAYSPIEPRILLMTKHCTIEIMKK